MRRFLVGLTIAAFVLSVPAMASADDEQIAQQIVQKLQGQKSSGNLKSFGIDLEVENGAVLLKGDVASPEQMNLVLETVYGSRGVVRVINNMSVGLQGAVKGLPAVNSVPMLVAGKPSSTNNWLTGFSGSVKTAFQKKNRRETATRQVSNVQAEASSPVQSAQAVGTGISEPRSVARPNAAPQPRSVAARPAPQRRAVRRVRPAGMQSVMTKRAPQARLAAAPLQTPLPYAPVSSVGYSQGGQAPVPMHMASGGGSAVRYDNPQMPGYAWPSYAAHPNYGAVTYPRQYSPTAWPYIGPFYPYPQVPLGWRKVTLEWDDGWWQLDFKNR